MARLMKNIAVSICHLTLRSSGPAPLVQYVSRAESRGPLTAVVSARRTHRVVCFVWESHRWSIPTSPTTKQIEAAILPRQMTHTERRSNHGKEPPLSKEETEKPQKPPAVIRPAKTKSTKAGLFRIATFIAH